MSLYDTKAKVTMKPRFTDNMSMCAAKQRYRAVQATHVIVCSKASLQSSAGHTDNVSGSAVSIHTVKPKECQPALAHS